MTKTHALIPRILVFTTVLALQLVPFLPNVITQAAASEPCVGDLTSDGIVDGRDLAAFRLVFIAGPCQGACPGDLDTSGTIDSTDVQKFALSFGRTDCPPPQAGPLVVIDPIATALPGSLVLLDGSRSTDLKGGPLTFDWQQISGPLVTLWGASTNTASFEAPATDGDLVFELTVTTADPLSSKEQFTVTVVTNPPPPLLPSIDLIDQDDSLTAQEKMIYKVFAVFGDSELPSKYQGSGFGQTSGTSFLAELVRNYDTLSNEQKGRVYPYLVPPYVTNSWYDLASQQATAGLQGGAMVPMAAPAHPWQSVAIGKVKVWYQDNYVVNYADGTSATYQALAEGIRDAASGTIWPALQGLMQREPLSDAGVALPAHPGAVYGQVPGLLDANGALDIVLCSGMNASGYTIPYKADPTPTYITIAVDMWPLGSATKPGLIQIVAHEMMHAWQFSYEKKDLGADYSYAWLQEATAAWAEDFVYPDANSENRYADWYLDTMPLSIDNTTGFRQYGEYTAFSFWSHNAGGNDIVRQAWEATKTKSGIDAADMMNPVPPPYDILLPHRYVSFWERYWGDYLVSAWNRGADGYFYQKDKLPRGAKVRENTPVLVDLQGKPDRVFFLDDLDSSGTMEFPYLSGRSYHFVFNDDTARTVMFYDGLRSTLELMADTDGTTVYAGVPLSPAPTDPMADPAEGATWRMLAKIDGNWQEWEPEQGVNTTGMVPFCRDAKAERLQELVVVLGNSSATKENVVKPPGESPLLLVSNMACWGWSGTFTHTSTPSSGPRETTTATIQLRRQQDLSSNPMPSAMLGAFLISEGQFHTTVRGQSDDCTYSGSDSWSGNQQSPGPDTPDGGLATAPQLRAGPMYRGYDGSGDGGGHSVEYTVTCKDTTSTSDLVPSWWESKRDAVYPSISTDGTHISGSLDYDDEHYEWNLQAVREK